MKLPPLTYVSKPQHIFYPALIVQYLIFKTGSHAKQTLDLDLDRRPPKGDIFLPVADWVDESSFCSRTPTYV